MEEKTLKKIALVFSLLSLVLLYIYLQNQQLDFTPISQAKEEPEGNTVKIFGRVKRFTNTNKVAFIELEQQEFKNIDIVLFKDRNITLQKNDLIEVEGSLEEYQGEKEIIANRIELKE